MGEPAEVVGAVGGATAATAGSATSSARSLGQTASVNTFSPEGRLFQVEYAIEAIKLGSTTVGIQTSEGVVLAVEKRTQSPLLESDSVEKIMEIDRHIGCAMSGLTADARTMVEHARVTAQNHVFTYDEPIKVESVTQSVSDLALRFGEGANEEDASMSRPFGVALLIAGIDHHGPQLFHADPSGTFMRYHAKAIGSGSEGAQSELQDSYDKSMTLAQAKVLALKVLKQVMEEKLDHNNVQLAQVVPEQGYSILKPDQLHEIIAQIEAGSKSTKSASSAPTASPSTAPAFTLDKRGEDALCALGKYDTVFLVDDSGSMMGVWEAQLATALSAVVKTAAQYDDDGVDIAFFNSRERCTSTSSDEILEVFRRVKPRYKTPTADAVRRVLEPYMQTLEEWQRSGKEKGKPRPKPLNLVILTDGAPHDDQNPRMVLVETARRLDAGRFPPFQVGCSFVQIGNYTEAAEHLRMLDDDLKEKHGIRDMVDTTLFEGSCSAEYLLKALLGGINRSIDRQGQSRRLNSLLNLNNVVRKLRNCVSRSREERTRAALASWRHGLAARLASSCARQYVEESLCQGKSLPPFLRHHSPPFATRRRPPTPATTMLPADTPVVPFEAWHGFPQGSGTCQVTAFSPSTLEMPESWTIHPARSVSHRHPVLVFLIKHQPTGKLVLFDLGLTKDWTNYIPHDQVSQYEMFAVEVQEDLADVLAKKGVKTEDIDVVIISHHHFDHSTKPEIFTKAEIIVGPGVKERIKALEGHKNVRELSWHHSPAHLATFEHSYDVFGDGAIVVVPTEGHTEGHISALVRTATEPSVGQGEGEYVVLAADCCHHGILLAPKPNEAHYRLGRWRNPGEPIDVPPQHSNYDDYLKAEQTLERIKAINRKDEVMVVLAHNFTQWEKWGGKEKAIEGIELNNWRKRGLKHY
ncbi:putative proteasome subunit alpha type-5 [Rhodotorula toruloides]|nr:putative proteasome subunit alpha type-5 [Rhodotorula toruloides]